MKDFGAVDETVKLYEECVKLEPASTSFCLNLVHTLEVVNEHDKAFRIVKEFLKRNPTLNVGKLTCAHVYNTISNVDKLSDFCNWLPQKPVADPNRTIPLPDSSTAPAISRDIMYSEEALDLLALLCTTVKLCYAVGALSVIGPISALVGA